MRQNGTAVTRPRMWLEVGGIAVTLKRSEGSGGVMTGLAGIAIEAPTPSQMLRRSPPQHDSAFLNRLLLITPLGDLCIDLRWRRR